MKKLFIVILIFFCSYSQLFSQSQIIFSKVENRSYVIKFNQSDNHIKKAILNKLSQSYNIPVSNVRINFNFKEKREILRKGYKLDFIVTISNIELSGHNKYKDFDISNSLVPKKLSFKLQWFKNNNIENEYIFNDIVVRDHKTDIVNMSVNDSGSVKKQRLVLKDMVFKYSLLNRDKFNSKLIQIDKYYKDTRSARNKIRLLKDINTDRTYLIQLLNIEDLNRYRDTAASALNFITNVRKRNYWGILNINNNDPALLKKKLSDLNKRADLVKTICDDILDNLDQIYYERGMKAMLDKRYNFAEANFKHSININKNYAPSHFQLARIFYNRGELDRSVDKIFAIRGMSPDNETKMQTVEFARGIYNEFILDASDLNNRGRFDDAIHVIRRASRLCRDFPEVKCRSNMDVQMSRAINGKYILILRNIEYSLKSNDLIKAEEIIRHAQDFAGKNRQFIVDNSLIGKKIADLYYKYLDRGDNFNSLRKFDSAIGEFTQAQRVCNTYREINCSDDLSDGFLTARTGVYNSYIDKSEQSFISNKNADAEGLIESAIFYREKYGLSQSTKESKLFLNIKQAVYSELIEKGRTLFSSGNYKDALRRFEEAQQIEKDYGIRSNIKLRTYITDAAIKRIIEIIDDGENEVKLNRLQGARAAYGFAKGHAEKYNLENSSEVTNALSNLKDKIFKQECINAQNDFNKIFHDATNFIKQKKFISADNKLAEALNYANKYSQCEIDTREVKDKRNIISVAVNYSKKIKTTENYINSKNYKKAIEEYMNAESYFEANRISEFGLNHAPLYDYIQSNYSDFIIYSVGFYNFNKEYTKAIDLLKELDRRHSKNKYTKDVQLSLGTEMATSDFEKNPSSNYKSNIAKYTSGSKFFKYFMKAYKKQWKLLD